jgi:hypothetical protein
MKTQPQFPASRYYPAKQIVPNLWIGSASDAESVQRAKKRNIRFVVNCSRDIPEFLKSEKSIAVYRIPIDDWHGHGDALFGHLPSVVRAIDDVLKKGQGVLVHCYAGMQRSAATVAAYLIWKKGMSTVEAMDFIRGKKPEAFTPRPTFLRTLRKWERHVRDGRKSHQGPAAKGK